MFNALGEDRVAWMHENLTPKEMFSGDAARLSQYQVIGGHFTFHEIYPLLGDDCKYVAVLRDPVPRAISAYSYLLRTPEHHMHKMVSRLSMLQSIRAVPFFRNEIENYQCSYLSEDGSRTFEAALASITAHDIHVTTLTRYADMLEDVRQTLGLSGPIQETRENSAPANAHALPEFSSPVLLAEIDRLNVEDQKLYQHFEQKS